MKFKKEYFRILRMIWEADSLGFAFQLLLKSILACIPVAQIFENIKMQSKEKVCIIIRHRLYNLKFADRIYVMEAGEFVEQGTFEELKSNSTIFNALYEQQKL